MKGTISNGKDTTTAVAVAAVAAPNNNTNEIIHYEVPPKPNVLLGLTFGEENPLRITGTTCSTTTTTSCEITGKKKGGEDYDHQQQQQPGNHHRDIIGYYVSSLQLPQNNLEISNILTVQQLNHFVNQFTTHQRRTLALSRTPPPTYPLTYGCVYTFSHLPIGDLGVEFKGFNPPVISQVLSQSPLAEKVHINQGVHAVLIPGQAALDTSTPGFTGARVQQELHKYNKTVNRILIVFDVVYDDTIKPGSGRHEVQSSRDEGALLFDFGGLIPSVFLKPKNNKK